MEQAIVFPKEFERNFFRDLDRSFVGIWMLVFLIFNSTVFYMQSLPVKELTAEQVEKFTSAIYRVPLAKKPKRDVVRNTGSTIPQEIPVDVPDKVLPDKDKTLTVEDRRKAQEKRRAEQRAKAEEKRKAIADRFKIPTAPTVKGNRHNRGNISAIAMAGLQPGKMDGFKLDKSILGIATNANDIKTIKKARQGGVITEDIGEITIADMDAFFASSDFTEMLSEASLKLTRGAITTSAKKTSSAGRSQAAISQVILSNKNQVHYCYWTFKRRDSSLKGRIVVEITIAPIGEVIRVRFRNSNWERNPLRKDVEKCITNIIKQWRFEPIDNSEGNVTACATYIFE